MRRRSHRSQGPAREGVGVRGAWCIGDWMGRQPNRVNRCPDLVELAGYLIDLVFTMRVSAWARTKGWIGGVVLRAGHNRALPFLPGLEAAGKCAFDLLARAWCARVNAVTLDLHGWLDERRAIREGSARWPYLSRPALFTLAASQFTRLERLGWFHVLALLKASG